MLEEDAKIIQLIVFNLGNEEYGADINQVREIIRTGTVTPIPDSPDFIKGVSNIRGEIPVIIDLKSRFLLDTDKTENKHIVITEQDKNIFGLLVDEVTEVYGDLQFFAEPVIFNGGQTDEVLRPGKVRLHGNCWQRARLDPIHNPLPRADVNEQSHFRETSSHFWQPCFLKHSSAATAKAEISPKISIAPRNSRNQQQGK